jgi:hypothetical protein
MTATLEHHLSLGSTFTDDAFNDFDLNGYIYVIIFQKISLIRKYLGFIIDYLENHSCSFSGACSKVVESFEFSLNL